MKITKVGRGFDGGKTVGVHKDCSLFASLNRSHFFKGIIKQQVVDFEGNVSLVVFCWGMSIYPLLSKAGRMTQAFLQLKVLLRLFALMGLF